MNSNGAENAIDQADDKILGIDVGSANRSEIIQQVRLISDKQVDGESEEGATNITIINIGYVFQGKISKFQADI